MLVASSSLGSTKTLATRAYQSSGLKHDLQHIPENEPENRRGVRARRVRCPPLFTPDRKREDQGVDVMHYTERTGAASNHFAAQAAVLPGSPAPARIGSPQHVARGLANHFAAQAAVLPGSPAPARIGSPQHVARGLGGNLLRWDGPEPRHHTPPLRQTASFSLEFNGHDFQ